MSADLTRPLTDTDLAAHVRLTVINAIFQINLTTEELLSRDGGLSAWFSDWFEEQCSAATSQVSARTYQDLLQILTCIQSSCQSAPTSRLEITDQICAKFSSSHPVLAPEPKDAKLNASLTLAARLWLSISIDSLPHFFTPGYVIRWDSDQCLSDAVAKEFSSKSQTTETVKLPKVFTAANLEKIAGIQVQWTSNLADHLALKDDDKKVMFFHQASFLELSRVSKM